MEKYYSSERNVQILVSLLKAHRIRKIVASPGTTNLCLLGSLQQDPYFEIYSSVDERSAAYIACGMAAECEEPVALSCTGATASRNYVPGLTEAYYRKLPVLAITSTQHSGRVGQLCPQVIDRSNPMNDITKLSVQVSTVHDAEDEWASVVAVNRALLELRRHGGGPVHINLTTTYSKDFSVRELPSVRVIERICYGDQFPALNAANVGIYVGAHKKWDTKLTEAVDAFCEKFNAAVFCDHTSNYHGKYRVAASLVCMQDAYRSPLRSVPVVIHIGEVSGAEISLTPEQVWRVNPDGEIRDVLRKSRFVFEMEEIDFFRTMCNQPASAEKGTPYYAAWEKECRDILAKIPELPFSNAWIAQQTAHRLPQNAVLHLGILNSLRSWNFFDADGSIDVYSNTGGFGIDGCISSLIGASLMAPNTLFFGVVGDLAFFYDMNSLGNRHVGNNIRLLLVNNGRGTEFRNYNHPVARFDEDADKYMAAAGHYGCQSPSLVRHYATDLGFEYRSASNKDEYLANLEYFVSSEAYKKPVLFEVFTDSHDESDALKIMRNLEVSSTGAAKQMVKSVFGEKGVEVIKKFVKR